MGNSISRVGIQDNFGERERGTGDSEQGSIYVELLGLF